MAAGERPGHHYDVVVVGLGPVGAVVANLLGKAGVRTLVVEQATEINRATARHRARQRGAAHPSAEPGSPTVRSTRSPSRTCRCARRSSATMRAPTRRARSTAIPSWSPSFSPSSRRRCARGWRGDRRSTCCTGVAVTHLEQSDDSVLLQLRAGEEVTPGRGAASWSAATAPTRSCAGGRARARRAHLRRGLARRRRARRARADRSRRVLVRPGAPDAAHAGAGWAAALGVQAASRRDTRADGAARRGARAARALDARRARRARARLRVPLPRAPRRSLLGRARLSRRRRRPPDAAVRRPGAGVRAARRGEPRVEDRRRRRAARLAGHPRLVHRRAPAARGGDDRSGAASWAAW